MTPRQRTPRCLHRRSAGGHAQLSYAQERMWFLNQLEPGTTLYSGVRATSWKGDLDVKALEGSVGELLRRHEILRTRFPLGPDGPVQEIQHFGSCRLPLVDLSSYDPAGAMDATRSWLVAESRRPFELTQETPFRAALLRLAQNEHVLALTIHHIAFDRWSRNILRRELLQLYSALAAGRSSPLPDPPVQYQDYAEWQRERMQDEDMVEALNYWRDQLRGAPSKLHLPTDLIEKTARSYLGRQVRCSLGESLVGELSRLSRQERSSLFMTLLTAFVALLARITGQTDLVVGVPIAGRTQVELSGLIGCCTNTLVLRTDASGNPTLRKLLERVRRVSLDGYAHQELPFEYLVRELQPERRPGQHPLFQVLFNYLDFPSERLSTPGVAVEDVEVPSETALVDLGVDIRRADRDLSCTFSCNAGLFEASTVNRLMQNYLATLESFASNPDRAISTLPDYRPDSAETDRLVQELERMTDEEAERQLATELRSGTG
jgi:hypothetical protein